MPLKESSQSNQRKAQLLKICKALPELIIEPAGDHLCSKMRKKTLAYYPGRAKQRLKVFDDLVEIIGSHADIQLFVD